MAKQAEHEEIWKAFSEVVNMTPAALEKHLGSQESRSVGFVHEGECSLPSAGPPWARWRWT